MCMSERNSTEKHMHDIFLPNGIRQRKPMDRETNKSSKKNKIEEAKYLSTC